MALAIIWIAASALPEIRAVGAFDHWKIVQGEWWRLLTGHLVHLGAVHAALNLLGWWLIRELLWQRMSMRQAGVVLLSAAVAVDAGLWWHAGIEWYAGASGMLHGLWAACVLERCSTLRFENPGSRWCAEADWIGWIGGALLVAKLLAENWLGPSEAMEQWIGAPVIESAHWYGALGGALGWLAVSMGRWTGSRSSVRNGQH